MKKIMMKLLTAVFMLLTVLQPVHAREKANTETFSTDYSNYELIDSSVKHTEKGLTIKKTFKDKNIQYNSLTDEYTESYIFAVKYLDNDELSQMTKTETLRAIPGSEYPPFFYGSITTNVTFSYTQVYGSNNVKYYRLNTLSYAVSGVYDGFIILDSYIEIANNGVGNVSIVTGQTQHDHLGTSTSGTVNGISSWTPSISIDPDMNITATRFYVQINAKRGTNSNYSESWMRSF
ncbi:MAG: hypothetical protein K6A40_03455 [Solobacterium sp.]|nr:hypothetical protein [Solobacterium sp.]